jgi:catechol 2,3-dioxygenase
VNTDAAARAETSAAGTLPADLRLGPVHLTVTGLQRSVGWYERSLGLVLHRNDAGEAELGDGVEPVVVLHQDPAAGPAGRHAGLYHYALLSPSREELARAALRLAATQTPIQGASDHGTHEAIYLGDPDGNGVELAADRPREQWPPGFGPPDPLDVQGLLSTIAGEQPSLRVGSGLRVGHVHLHVGDVDRGLAFYRDVVGFEEQAHMGSAAFVSVDGYHHHLGFNVWRGLGVGPAPAHTVGLRHWTVQLPAEADVERVRARMLAAGLEIGSVEGGFVVHDPWDIAVAFLGPAQ